jgi:hypothetical protein
MEQSQLVDPAVFRHQHELRPSFLSLAATAGGEKERSDEDEALDTPALIEGARIDLLIQPLDEEDREPPPSGVENHRRSRAPDP